MTVGCAIKIPVAGGGGEAGCVVAWVGRGGAWERATSGRMEKEFGKVWGEHGVFPAMTGMDFAFLLEPAPRHDGPDPSFRYLAGAGRPRVLDPWEDGALIEGRPL